MHERDRSLIRALAVLSAVLLAGAVVGAALILGSVAPAQAAAAGTITVSPRTGTVDESPMFALATASAPCPAAFSNGVALRIGPAAGPFKNLAPGLGGGGHDTKTPSVQPNKSFTKALGAAPKPGDYLLILVCANEANVEAPQRFETKLTVTDSTWTADSEVSPAVETRTTLALAPTTHAPKGDPVTMTATVTPVAAVGTVAFKSGNGVIGTPVPVNQGVATLTVSSLVAGVNQLSAVFAPTDSTAFLPSSSPVVAYQIDNRTPPSVTTTVLAVTPTGQAPKGDPVKMTATVAPDSAVGTVTFRAGDAVIGNPIQVAQGVATLTVSSLVAGVNQLSAVFTPSDPNVFVRSTSAVIEYKINASVSASASASASASPDPTDDPTPDPTDEPEPSDSPSPTPSPSAGGPGSLPKTGPAVLPVAAWGVGLLVGGIAAVLLARRRTRP